MKTNLVVIAKEPRPGFVKTRLCPPCEPDEAAAIARACLADTLRAVSGVPDTDRFLALDGEPGPWLPRGFVVFPQRGDGLSARLANAFAHVGGPCLLVGMDTPQVTSETLGAAVTLLRSDVDAVLGPTEDGGWWALGVKRPNPQMFREVPMSAADTYDKQLRRLRELGWEVADLPRLIDIDHFPEAQRIAAAHPHLEMARSVRRLALLRARTTA